MILVKSELSKREMAMSRAFSMWFVKRWEMSRLRSMLRPRIYSEGRDRINNNIIGKQPQETKVWTVHDMHRPNTTHRQKAKRGKCSIVRKLYHIPLKFLHYHYSHCAIYLYVSLLQDCLVSVSRREWNTLAVLALNAELLVQQDTDWAESQ